MSIKLQRIIAHIAVEVYGFKSFAKLLRLGYVFFKKESFESFKKRSWTRNFDHCGPRLDFFSCRGFEVQSKPLKHFFSAGRELSIHSIITVIHFSRAIKLYKRFYEIISRNYEFRKFWSVDYSFRYFLSHSISSANQVVMQIGELTIRGYFGPCSHVTETQGFFKQKNWKASENVQKSEITRWYICVMPLNVFTACVVYILKRVVRSWLQSAGFDNTEWIKRSNKYLPQQFFKRQIIFKAREYLIKKIP